MEVHILAGRQRPAEVSRPAPEGVVTQRPAGVAQPTGSSGLVVCVPMEEGRALVRWLLGALDFLATFAFPCWRRRVISGGLDGDSLEPEVAGFDRAVHPFESALLVSKPDTGRGHERVPRVPNQRQGLFPLRPPGPRP